MLKDKHTPIQVFNLLNKLNISYCIGGLSLVDYNKYSIIDKHFRSSISIYLFEKSIIKLSLFTFIIFFKGLLMKPEFSSQNKRFKLRRKLFKKIFNYKDNIKYHIYLVRSHNKSYYSIISGRREIYFKKNDLNKNKLLKVPYKSSKIIEDKLLINIPNKTDAFVKKYKSNLLSEQYKYYSSNFYHPEEVEKGVRLLSRVVDIIEDIGLEYWLEGGTCLGAVRDGHFIPWDHDVDLGVKFESEEKMQLLLNQLKSFFNIRPKGFSGKHKKQFGKYRLIKIAANKNIFNKIKEQILRNFGYRNDFNLDLFIFYKQPLNGDANNLVYKYVVFNKVGYHEKEYLDSMNKIAFYNREYNIPNNVENWLTTKYGKDWKAPKEEWHVNLDDKTLNLNPRETIKS
tara:strand:- start:1578 stop:2768 length:1191 start_codon:yes stop_codon:yes gene_type:complete